MSKTHSQFDNHFINDTGYVANMDLLDLQDDSLEEFLEPFRTSEDFPNIPTPSLTPFDSYKQSSSESSPESNHEAMANVTTNLSFNNSSTLERFRMIEQPYQRSKLRYRTDYIREKRRVGALGIKNEKAKTKGPAIYIPPCYLNPNDGYYIRISLVTIKHNKTNLHYFHPYEIEHPKNEDYNDRQNNSVWFPIESNDSIKNFPLLRIVKKKGSHVQKLGHLRVFDSINQVLQNTPVSQQSLHTKIDVMKEFNLEKSQLAFTLGKKVMNNGQLSLHIYTDTTIFSDPMDENDERQSDTETDAESSSEKATSSSLNNCIYKYAPRSGLVRNNDEMLIFLKNKIEAKKYGDLQIVFECDTAQGHWSQPVANLDIKDRMISFKTPIFPYQITNPTIVDIVVRQKNSVLGVLKYSYLPVP